VGGYPTPTGERRFIATDDELVRVYRNGAGERVTLYIGYYHRQVDGKELTGEAGAALAAAASPITLTSESGGFDVNEIVRARAGARRGVFFWYDVNGRIVSEWYRLKSYTIWDAITRRRTNGAVVIIAWSSKAGPDSQAARARAIEFAQALMPVLRRHLPS
jgi:EpsI family protein